MKIFVLVVLSFLLFSNQSYSNDSIASLEYEIIKSNETQILRIKIKFKKTEGEYQTDFRSFFNNKTATYIEEIKEQIKREIDLNDDVSLSLNIPNYMYEIIDLIEDESKQKKGMEIYVNNNLQNLIQTSNNQNTSIIDNKTITRISAEFKFPILLKNNTILKLQPIKFKLDDKVYQTEETEIVLEF